jgi:two-component system, cell cycle sensor histidine kinase and response regulator CckA
MSDLLRSDSQKIDPLIGSFLTGRHPANGENPRNRFFALAVLVLALTLFSFSVLNLFSMNLLRGLAAALAGAGQIVGLLILRHAAHPRIAFRISALVLLGYLLFHMSVAGPQGARIFWMLVFPVYAFLLFGGREGLIWTTAGFLGCLCVLLDPNDVFGIFSPENNKFFLTYVLLGVLARAFESVVSRTQEDMVRDRTRQLEGAIRRLYTEIEERKSIEEALRLSEERSRTFSDAAFEGIGFTDGQVFLDLNDQLAHMLGYERTEMIGMPVMLCVAPEHRELVGAAIRSAKEGPYEHLALRKDGSIFPVEIQARESNVGGRVMRATAIRDISERKKTEAEIKEAKEYAEAVLDSLPGTFYVFDEQSRLTRWNKNFEKVSGYSPDELPGKHLLEFIEEKERVLVTKKLGETFVHGTGSVEATTLTKAGAGIPYLFTAVWRTLGERQYLLGTGVDISDRKKAEDLLRRSEELFRTVFETAPDAVSISKVANGIFVDANQSFSEIMGYSRDELIGKSALDLNVWADVHVRNEVVRSLVTTGFARNLESTFVRKDGAVKQGLLSASTTMLDGEAHLLAVVKDITDLKKAQEERLRFERQVQHAQKLESLGILAGGIAHDFNNILTSILGNADLGLMRISPMAPARRNLEEIQKGALRAAGLANQMLAYSGKGKFELKSIDLSALVKEMAQLLDVSISKKATLTYDLADNLPAFEGDVNQIQQIVMNLITNASEALGIENGVIRLSTTSAFCDRTYLDTVSESLQASYEEPLPEGLYVSLEVSDTGCGMDLDTQKKVFDPFFTTKFSGRGLGMAAALGIVRGHRGAVKIYSEIGKGATFKVLFPVQGDAEVSPERAAEHEDVHQFLQGGLVLVADDEGTVCDIAREMLEEIGLTVLTASDGNQAVEMFRESVDKISFVLLDLTMPGLDGAQAFYEMRRLNPDVKVILSSGYNEQDVTHRFVGKGLAGFIQKPYTMAKLIEKLNEVLR